MIDLEEIDITPWCIRLKPAAAVSQELRLLQNDKGRIDFGDTTALNAYNRAAFKVMAGLELTIPQGNLIPTACLRQAYLTILVEELLPRGSTIVEIGTGATAVISMLAAKNHDLKVIATEISSTSHEFAGVNISNNGLSDKITLLLSSGGIIRGVLDDLLSQQSVDAILCYPPTYPEEDSKFYHSPQQGSGFMGTVSEMIGGGDDGYTFIQQYIAEAATSSITYITVLLIFEIHATKAMEQLRALDKSPRCINLRAGTRTRFLIIAKN